MPSTGDVATWSSPAFLDAATDWIDEQLIAHGLERTGRVTQTHLRPWSTVLRADTTGGPVWLKAPAPGTASEVPLYAILARVVPDHILVPLATDLDRSWLLLPDGGPSLGEKTVSKTIFSRALGAYAEVQRALEPHVEDLLSAGIADHRPQSMPDRFEEAIDVVQEMSLRRFLRARRAVVEGWCARLTESVVPVTLDHNDLHPWNVLGPPWRFYDWGDAVVAHPFASVMRFAPAAARDAYLEAFADLAPHEELVETMELAMRVNRITQVLIWERSIAAAREQGVELENRFAIAPLEAAAAILDD